MRRTGFETHLAKRISRWKLMAAVFGLHGTGEAANRQQTVTPLRWGRRLSCPLKNTLGPDGLIALGLGERSEVAQQPTLDPVLEAQGAA
jgi:hypothetical protein